MAICPTCSERGTPGALFCGSCGSRLVPDAEPVAGHESGDPFVGQTIHGTYVIQERIGSGGMGDVYRAIHQKLGSPVAVKIVKRALLGHSALVHRFQREARAASRLRHPNVVAVTDYGQSDDGTLFMVMEYVTGRSLARVIAEEAPLPERRVVHIGAQILSALAEAHANHILHRDLKPENVMLASRRDAPDAVKVLDFGIAKLLAAGVAASTLTQAGFVCGTPGYMSPEQLRGDDVDARSDLFSVGVVLYELLTHKLPFQVHTPMEMLHRQLSEPIAPPSVRRGRPVSPALEELVLQALSAARDERPPSAAAMRSRLLRAALSPSEADRDVAAPIAAIAPEPVARSEPRPSPSPAPAPPPSRRTPRARSTPSGPAVPRRPPSGGGRTAALDPAFLKRIEDRIAPLLGPVAPYVTQKVRRGAVTLDDFCHELAAFIPSTEDQKEFLAWSSAQLTAVTPRPGTDPPPPTPPATPTASWDPAVLDRARRELAVYLGPLARVVVRRACARARDVRELYELLALELPRSEREAFRRRAPADPGDSPPRP